MTLIRFDDVSLDFGDQAILDRASLAIEPGECVCLIGQNGAGKTTTLRLIAGEIEPDRGAVVRRDGLALARLEQTLPESGELTVRELVRAGLAELDARLAAYRELAAGRLDERGMRELEALHREIDARGGWQIEQRVEATMSELALPPDKPVKELSGGWRRRAALAAALVRQPDLLLLDEPTNHLDIVTIRWLENVVQGFAGAVLFITHDREFLERLATRIVEIDRGRLTSWPGDFENYLRRKEKALEDEAAANARFDRKLAQEEAWIRQGIKARRTRNEGRARALEQMRRERAARVGRDGRARMHIEEADDSGRRVIRAKNVSYRYGDEPLIEQFSIDIVRGDRIGLLGNNGVGKSTLLRLLLGELAPQTGTVKHGTNLEVAWFDQLRVSLDPDRTVAENVAEGRTHVNIGGRERHVIGYLKGFLFSPERARVPVRALSGGEQNRVILARLFARPANLLVLDEPTNDLDMETLEVLEEKLVSFNGTLLVVSHDRRFLDNVVTSTIAFEGNGRLAEYVGGYRDWLRQGRPLAEVERPEPAGRDTPPRRDTDPPRERDRGPRKLSYHERRELDALPARIEALESRLGTLQATVSAPDFYAQDRDAVRPVLDELADAETELERLVERWSALEELEQAWRERRSR